MRDFAALELVPNLQEFALWEGARQLPEQLLPVLRNSSVRWVSAGLGSDKKNRAFAALRDKNGKKEWMPIEPFEYR